MSFHLYRINELYSNASGTVQFIELAVGNANGESFFQGVALTATSGGVTHSFSFPTNLPSTATANTTVLIATQGYANLPGVPAPNFIVPDGFLFPGGGTLNFGGVDSVTYGALPSDGTSSINRTGTTAPATPKNFAGATGSLPTPGPAPINGTAGNDTLTGTAGNDQVNGLGGNDRIVSTAGTDTYSGGTGIDTVSYPLARSAYTLHLRQVTDNASTTIEKPSAAGVDTLVEVERLQFSDFSVAYDLTGDGHAYQTAKLLSAVFGRESLSNKAFAGIGLSLLDGGMSYRDLAALAVAAAGKTTPTDIVALLWTNVVGAPPTPAEAAPFVAMLNGGTSVGELAVLAADTTLNIGRINLVGLSATGLEYVGP